MGLERGRRPGASGGRTMVATGKAGEGKGMGREEGRECAGRMQRNREMVVREGDGIRVRGGWGRDW